MQTTRSTRTVSIAQLRREGFSREEIRRLKALREQYPIREHVTNAQGMRRLELLRWMRQNGRLDD